MRRISLIPLLVLAAACVPPRPTVVGPALSTFEPIRLPEELVRPTRGNPAQVIAAVPAVFADLSLAAVPAEPGANVRMSYPTLVHGSWPPAAVAQRLICGAPFPRESELVLSAWDIAEWDPFDLRGAIAWTHTLPVEVRIGFESVDRIGGSTTRLIVDAVAERPAFVPNYMNQIACVPTRAFVDELFLRLDAAIG